MNSDALVQELIAQLQTVLGTTLDSDVQAGPATASGKAWTVRITVQGLPPLTLAFDEAGSTELARVTSGQPDAGPDAIVRALRELCGHVVTSTLVKLPAPDDTSVDIQVSAPADWPTGVQTAMTVGFSCPTLPATLIVSVSAGEAAPAQVDVPAAPAPALKVERPVSTPERLDVLLDIDLPLVVRFGCTQLPLKALSRLGPGSLIDLSRAPDDPVEMLVSDRVVARGEVVVVSGSYGIRITDVVSTRDNSRGGHTL